MISKAALSFSPCFSMTLIKLCKLTRLRLINALRHQNNVVAIEILFHCYIYRSNCDWREGDICAQQFHFLQRPSVLFSAFQRGEEKAKVFADPVATS